jgi:drug/metabolite transporter (DMT)-like permease
MRRAPHAPLVWLLLGVLAMIWGSSFILIKRGLFHEGQPVLPPGQLAAARLAIAWIVLSPVLLRHARLMRAHWLPLLGSGLLGNGIPAFLFAWAQTRIDSSLSGMLNSLTPLMTLISGAALFSSRLRWVHITGVLLGLVGAVGLIRLGAGESPPGWSYYALLPVLGTVCYGLSGNIVKYHLGGLPPLAISALALTWVGPPALLLSLGNGFTTTLSEHPMAWRSLAYVAALATFSSAIALVLWNMLLQRTTALAASSVTYLMPIVAIGWGFLDGEPLGLGQMAMIGVVLAGVYLVNAGRSLR